MHVSIDTAQQVAAQAGASQDRVAVIPAAGGLIVVVADGAGGSGDGAAAADAVVEHVRSSIAQTADPWDARNWSEVLRAIDDHLVRTGVGESTAVVLAVSVARVIGAAVGDSHAWLIGTTGHEVLTASSRRKPLLGRGEAIPACFAAPMNGSTLLVATDGLLNYAPHAEIERVARHRDLQEAVGALVEAVRLPSGGLQDDVGLVLCRATAPASAPPVG